MQNFFIKLLEKLPNKLIGASKVKSYFLSKLAEDIFRYCSISENFKINVNLNNSSENYLWYGCVPKEIINFLKNNLRNDSVFIDCGANIGIWTIIALEFIKNEGKVHSFEPNLALCSRLKKNLTHNKLNNQCKVHKIALSSVSKKEFLYLNDINHQMGSLIESNNYNKIEIQTERLDSLNINGIDGMKIDVEGYELRVIEGAFETISTQKPWLVVELNNSYCKIKDIKQWEVYNYLVDVGYSTNFNIHQKLESSFCRDVVFYDLTKKYKNYPPFL